jgi:hypothetical protein
MGTWSAPHSGASAMADYSDKKLETLVGKVKRDNSAQVIEKEVIPYLVNLWLDEYNNSTPSNDIVETKSHNPDRTRASEFSYLFDIKYKRLIAAWGISLGREGAERDHKRMAGHPLSDGSHYHRGHAIPHRLGGPTDINLVAQLGSVNIGKFRVLENKAVRTPGALYFTYWVYGRSKDERPRRVEQGLVSPEGSLEIALHDN